MASAQTVQEVAFPDAAHCNDESLAFMSGDDAAVGGGRRVSDTGEAGCGQKIGDFFFGVAFAFGDGHEEGGVGGDGKRAGFIGVDVCVVDNEHPARRKGSEGLFQELFDEIDIPIVEDV